MRTIRNRQSPVKTLVGKRNSQLLQLVARIGQDERVALRFLLRNWRTLPEEQDPRPGSRQVGRPPLAWDRMPFVEVSHLYGGTPSVGLLHRDDNSERPYMVAR